jgi:hypothetical protein
MQRVQGITMAQVLLDYLFRYVLKSNCISCHSFWKVPTPKPCTLHMSKPRAELASYGRSQDGTSLAEVSGA